MTKRLEDTMPERDFHLTPIGFLETPHKDIQNMPIQPSGASGVRGKLILKPEFTEGIKDLDGFSHTFILYLFHKSISYNLTVTPFLDNVQHGVFSTRAPKRPNPIGLSVVHLLSVEDNILILENVDMLDGTPVLDIKPYLPSFDQPQNVRIGWLEGRSDSVKSKRSDDRFR